MISGYFSSFSSFLPIFFGSKGSLLILCTIWFDYDSARSSHFLSTAFKSVFAPVIRYKFTILFSNTSATNCKGVSRTSRELVFTWVIVGLTSFPSLLSLFIS